MDFQFEVAKLILIYVSIIVIAFAGTFLSISLYRISRLLTKIDHIMDYVDHVRNLLESWEQAPVRFINRMIRRFFG